MTVKIFVKDNCPDCVFAKELALKLERAGKHAEMHNISELSGLSEAVIHEVFCVPTVIIVENNNKEICAWRCKVPEFEELLINNDNSKK